MSYENWTKAFVEAQAELPTIRKTQSADTGKYTYTYADLHEILETVVPVLNKHGLAVSQDAHVGDLGVGVSTRIYHEDGHVEAFGPLLLPADRTAQSAGSAITYARRYALLAVLGIAPDEDDDGAAANVGGQQSAPHASPPAAGLQCPTCNWKLWDNREDNLSREKPWPAFKCKNDACKWSTWDEHFFESKPVREDYPPGEEPFDEPWIAPDDVENE